ncbi:MAG: short-chain dehydrogenase [Dehalococcoidia bacterium]|nr:short-chain dehydrogenase [Dehalococcoidia bacterium]|tara:strand:+ start:3019 stop:3855 length:837 start_codon:yes stop_codon:yes gene_type:complete
MGRLDDRVALVTGAGRYRGIGRAIVLRLAEEGANVVVTARARDASTFAAHEKEMGWKGIESVAEEVRATGRRALALNCDVTDKNELKRTVDSAIAEFGKIDVLVNNAALPSEAGAAPILEMTDENWYETVDVNLHGLYHTIRAVGREMVKGGGGSIVNISSTAGRIGIPNYGAYCATKWAMHGLTQQLALEFAKDNIRVNIVCPGSTDTDMMDSTFGRYDEIAGQEPGTSKAAMRSMLLMGRQATVEEQASVVAFLASDDSSYMTGQALNVDGGSRMD